MSSFAQFLSAANADPAVVGLVLIGSRSVDGMATDRSDHDVIAVVAAGHDWPSTRSRHLDVVVVSVDEFAAYAMPGHAEHWNRYAFVHARVLLDRLDGAIAESVRAKARLSDVEGRNLGRGALDAYVNSCYRSLKSVRDNRVTAARLDTAESVPCLLTALFAACGRVRPYNKYLEWELKSDPLPDPAFALDRLLPRLDRILRDGDPDTQRELFADVERVMRARGFGEVLDGWGDALQLLRPAPQDRRLAATRRVVAFLNRTHGTDFTVDREVPGGHQSGAYTLRDGDGPRLVLKWSADRSWARTVRRAEPVVAAARTAGWPTPAWLFVGLTPSGYPYQVQERAAGAHPDRVTRQLVRAVLPVLDIQAGLSPDTEQDWSAYDHSVVFADGSGFTTALASFSAAGAEFVETLRTAVAPWRCIELPTADLVHGDLNPANILLVGDRISAVVDVEAVGKGSRMHDLATLVVYAALWDGERGASDDLFAYARVHAAPGELEVSLAACLLAVLAFQTEHHPEGADGSIRTAIDLVPWAIAATGVSRQSGG